MSINDSKNPFGNQQPRSAFQLVFYFIVFGLASIIPILLAPSLIAGVSLVSLEKSQLYAVALLVGSYATALLLLFLPMVFRQTTHYLYKFLIVFIVFGASFFLLYEYQNQEIAFLVMTTVLVSGLCLWIFQRALMFPYTVLSVFVVATAVLIWLTDFGILSDRASGRLKTQKNLQTAFYNLQVTTYPGRIPRSIKGGGLTEFGESYLLATGDGRLYSIAYDSASDFLESRQIPMSVPLNADQFRDDVDQRVDTAKFRVADIYAQKLASGYRIYASHHFWKPTEQCFVLRLSATEGSIAELMSGKPEQSWQTVFETTPCLPLKDTGHAFAGHQVGGRIEMLDDKNIILTVGDHTFDGNGSKLILPQDDSSSYGKTILINVDTHRGVIFSKGHRNPQGLHIDRNNSIWSTEHGPQGGDELNLIVQDANYGWPFETYGTAYGKTEWPLSKDQGRHREFVAPAFAWGPNTGISNLISIGPSHFPLWESDLIVSTLARKSLYRIRIDDGRVRYLEEIKIGQRIRDLIEGRDGRLILWTDRAALITVGRTPQSNDGQQLFAACSGCHTIDDGTSHGIGPDLFGIAGRWPGTADNFEYSDALLNQDAKWDNETLDRYLASPSKFAPGTTMVIPGIADPAQRKLLVEYLVNDGQ